ncbi:MAG: hypothetical protein ACE5G5_13880 [Candidatus Methylomirabilales bacterium]
MYRDALHVGLSRRPILVGWGTRMRATVSPTIFTALRSKGEHMRVVLVLLVLLSFGIGPAFAHGGRIVDLKAAPPDHQVEAVRYCNGEYSVKLKDGSTRQFGEFDLRFKTDSGPNGPKLGSPALIRAGMSGDRAFLIFSGLEEMKGFLEEKC